MEEPVISPQMLSALYGLPVRSVTVAVRGVNRTFRIETEREAFYLRLYREAGRSRAQIDAEIVALSATAGNASVPVALAGGGYVFLCPYEEGSRHAVMFTAAPGRPPDATPDHLKIVAAELARLHHALQRVFPIGRPFEPETIVAEAKASLRALGEDFEPLCRRIEELEGGLCRQFRAGEAVLGVCHGDLWLGNTHLSEAGGVTFFDFDDCFDGPIIADVARLLASLRGHDVKGFGTLVEAIHDGYVTAMPFRPGDWGLVPALAQLDAIGGAGFLARFCTMPDAESWAGVRLRTERSLNDWSADGVATRIMHDTLSALEARGDWAGHRGAL